MDTIGDDLLQHVLLSCDFTALKQLVAVSHQLSGLAHSTIRSTDWARRCGNAAELRIALWTDRTPAQRVIPLTDPDSVYGLSVDQRHVRTAGVYDVNIHDIDTGTLVDGLYEGSKLECEAEIECAAVHGSYVAITGFGTGDTQVYDLAGARQLTLTRPELEHGARSLAWARLDGDLALFEYCESEITVGLQAVGEEPEGTLRLWRVDEERMTGTCVRRATLPVPPAEEIGAREYSNPILSIQDCGAVGAIAMVVSASMRILYSFNVSDMSLRHVRSIQEVRKDFERGWPLRWNCPHMCALAHHDGWTALGRTDGIVELWHAATVAADEEEFLEVGSFEEVHSLSVESAAIDTNLLVCGFHTGIDIYSRSPFECLQHLPCVSICDQLKQISWYGKPVVIDGTRVITTVGTSREEVDVYDARTVLLIFDVGFKRE